MFKLTLPLSGSDCFYSSNLLSQLKYTGDFNVKHGQHVRLKFSESDILLSTTDLQSHIMPMMSFAK